MPMGSRRGGCRDGGCRDNGRHLLLHAATKMGGGHRLENNNIKPVTLLIKQKDVLNDKTVRSDKTESDERVDRYLGAQSKYK